MTDKTTNFGLPYMPDDSAQLWQVYNWAIDLIDTKSARLDSGNAGTSFPDGQIITGNQYLYDTATQESDFIWIQEATVLKSGGFVVADFDPTQGLPPTSDDLIAYFGMTENPEQLGTKVVGTIFAKPEYKPYVGSIYDGIVQFQSLNIYRETNGPIFQWPQLDGDAASSLNTDSSGGLYWDPPPNPPEIIEDIDQTDYLVLEVGNLAPVTVTATRAAIPGQISFECTFFTASNNRNVIVELLIDGVQTGQVYTTPLPRNAETFVHHTWSLILPNGNEVIAVRHIAIGAGIQVQGTVTDTVLSLLIPSAALMSHRAVGTYIIDRYAFWDRWLDVEKENLSKAMRGEKWQPGPFPDDLLVFRIMAFFSMYTSQNVNLLLQTTIDNITELETLGILGAGRAAVILAT